MNYAPRLVSWNVTKRCDLRCSHCYLAAGESKADELSTAEAFELIQGLSVSGTEMLVLTGGEPLLREDLFALARYASKKGLLTVLGTNGILITADIAKKLREGGIRGVGISLDSLSPQKHDDFRGVKGAWTAAMRGLEICRENGLEIVVQTMILEMNYDEIPALIEFAHKMGAQAFNAYFLVCTGRGERLTDISPERYEGMLAYLVSAQAEYPDMLVRAKCAPHVKRIAYQRGSGAGSLSLLASAGCLAGTHYCRITPDGDVTPCPYLTLIAGNVRHQSFREIWETSELFLKLRDPSLLKGHCGACDFKELCGGCRARAFASTGDFLGEDPWCAYTPSRPPEQASSKSLTVEWAPEALARLERIPAFIRNRIRHGIEAYARQKGLSRVTPELMAEVRRTFFGHPSVRGPRGGDGV